MAYNTTIMYHFVRMLCSVCSTVYHMYNVLIQASEVDGATQKAVTETASESATAKGALEELETKLSSSEQTLAEHRAEERSIIDRVEVVAKNDFPILQTKLHQLNEERRDLEEHLKISNKECEVLYSYKGLYLKKKEQVDDIIALRENEIQNLKQNLVDKHRELSQAKEKLSRLQKELSVKNDELNLKSTRVQELEADVNSLKHRLRVLREKNDHKFQQDVSSSHKEQLKTVKVTNSI